MLSKSFIARAGDLNSASQLLRDLSYSDLFLKLADSRQKSNVPGWVLKEPRRRALRQIDLFKAFAPPSSADSLNNVPDSEKLPQEIKHLLNHDLLERGFQLMCSLCSAKIWYRVEDVGQSFTCHRCYEQQRLNGNPVWLYKLPEVVFQLLTMNAYVPLLALSTIAEKSATHFAYLLDFDIFQATDTKGQNIDFACLSDGLAYIGEAKTVDYIDEKQFSFYAHIARHVNIDGIVFATTEERWNASTMLMVDNLKKEFYGDVQALTRQDLLNVGSIVTE